MFWLWFDCFSHIFTSKVFFFPLLSSLWFLLVSDQWCVVSCQWLVKRAIETREEMGDYVRAYSISQFQRTHSLPEVTLPFSHRIYIMDKCKSIHRLWATRLKKLTLFNVKIMTLSYMWFLLKIDLSSQSTKSKKNYIYKIVLTSYYNNVRRSKLCESKISQRSFNSVLHLCSSNSSPFFTYKSRFNLAVMLILFSK